MDNVLTQTKTCYATVEKASGAQPSIVLKLVEPYWPHKTESQSICSTMYTPMAVLGSSTSSWQIPAGLPLPPVRTVSFSPLRNYKTSSYFSPISTTSLRCRRLGNCSSFSKSRLRVSCGAVREITQNEFSDVVLKSDRPVLVEFVATWCGPCRLIAPVMESIAQVLAAAAIQLKV